MPSIDIVEKPVPQFRPTTFTAEAAQAKLAEVAAAPDADSKSRVSVPGSSTPPASSGSRAAPS